MTSMQRLLLVCGAAAFAARGAAGCAGFEFDSCHRRMVAEYGCCPSCDAECRERVTAGCETEVHERPVELEEPSATETSSESGASSSTPYP
jgi:hypothetical protein